MKVKVVKILLLFVLGAALIASTSWATPILTITDNATSNSVTITDEGALDQWTETNHSGLGIGIVEWSGTLGVWTFNAVAGISADTGWLPNFHLDSVNKSTAAVSLTVSFSDTDPTWTPGVPGFEFTVGGYALGSSDFEVLIDGTSMSTLGPFGPGGFNGSDSFAYGGTIPASVELIGNIEHLREGTSSFNMQLNPVPEPATMLLLGTGLIGVAGAARRRKKNQA